MLRLSGQCRALSTVQLICVIVNCFAQMRPIIPCPDIMEHVLDHSICAIRVRGHVNDLPPSGLLMTSTTPELCKNLNYRTMCSQFHEKVALYNGRTSSAQNKSTHRAAVWKKPLTLGVSFQRIAVGRQIALHLLEIEVTDKTAASEKRLDPCPTDRSSRLSRYIACLL